MQTIPQAEIWSLCDESHVALVPWAEAGYTCCAVDLSETSDLVSGIQHLQMDVRALSSLPGARFVMAWPPLHPVCNFWSSLVGWQVSCLAYGGCGDFGALCCTVRRLPYGLGKSCRSNTPVLEGPRFVCAPLGVCPLGNGA